LEYLSSQLGYEAIRKNVLFFAYWLFLVEADTIVLVVSSPVGLVKNYERDARQNTSLSCTLLYVWCFIEAVIIYLINNYFFERFSLRFFLFSALSFLVIGFFLALLIPNSITV